MKTVRKHSLFVKYAIFYSYDNNVKSFYLDPESSPLTEKTLSHPLLYNHFTA